MSPRKINASALTAFEIQVSWEAVQYFVSNGVLRGYEVYFLILYIQQLISNEHNIHHYQVIVEVIGETTGHHILKSMTFCVNNKQHLLLSSVYLAHIQIFRN